LANSTPASQPRQHGHNLSRRFDVMWGRHAANVQTAAWSMPPNAIVPPLRRHALRRLMPDFSMRDRIHSGNTKLGDLIEINLISRRREAGVAISKIIKQNQLDR
jgi:hypothetical protein